MFLTISGTPCYHEAEAIEPIMDIIREFDPDMVIELGTKNGGFTEFIHESTRGDVPIYSYDVLKMPMGFKFRQNVSFFVADILSSPLDDIICLCSNSKKKFLYCDNGNKIKEFKMYAKHLNSGDLLGVHDWGTEITYESVKEVLVNFKQHKHYIFEESGCKTRFFIKD